MAQCLICGRRSTVVSRALSLCGPCITNSYGVAKDIAARAHREGRSSLGLVVEPPREEAGRLCQICTNECKVPEGEAGFCSLRRVQGGRFVRGGPRDGNLSWYYDPLPTNCVADWVCPGGTGAGFPRYAYRDGPEWGYKNLAVFYQACSFDCLFCQNWHFRYMVNKAAKFTAHELAERVDDATACICYFGGDPTPQLPHAVAASRLALKTTGKRILRICWETNGGMNRSYLKEMARLSLETGGCIKFDLKAYSEAMHLALCGVSNRRTFENFAYLATLCHRRREPPFLVASTLLVPGYVEEEEVRGLARFIAGLNPEIPYALLAFYPQFMMGDLPTTSREHALACQEAALDEGVKKVRIGNLHLLGREYC